MSDPYGRLSTPPAPIKPRYFSLTRPIRYLIWGWFYLVSGCFYWAYKGVLKNSSDEILALPITLFNFAFFVGAPTGIAALCGLGVFSWLFGAGWLLFQICFFFVFKLHDQEAKQYWKDRLVD